MSRDWYKTAPGLVGEQSVLTGFLFIYLVAFFFVRLLCSGTSVQHANYPCYHSENGTKWTPKDDGTKRNLGKPINIIEVTFKDDFF